MRKCLMIVIFLPGLMHGQWTTCPGTTSATCTSANVEISGAAGLIWGGGLLTVGASTTGGSLFVNTPSLSGGYFSGLGVAGTYGIPDKRSVINVNAYGPYSGGNYGADLAFSTTFNTGLNEVMRITATGGVGIRTTAPITLLSNTASGQDDGGRGVAGPGLTWVQTSNGDTGYTAGFVNPQSYTGPGMTAHGVFIKIADTSAQSNILSLLSGPDTSRLLVRGDGKVGIGTVSPCASGAPSNCLLSVNGGVQAKEVVVNTGWSDYVFAPDYELQTLRQTAAYIEQNHHLPNIPSATEVAEKGVGLGEMQAKLLAKIEELTLQMIRLDSRNQELSRQIEELRESRER